MARASTSAALQVLDEIASEFAAASAHHLASGDGYKAAQFNGRLEGIEVAIKRLRGAA